MTAASRPRIPASVGKGMARKEEQRDEQARQARLADGPPAGLSPDLAALRSLPRAREQSTELFFQPAGL